MKHNIFKFFVLLSITLSCNSNTNNSNLRSIKEKVEVPQLEVDKLNFIKTLGRIHDTINEPTLSDLNYESYRFNYLDAFQRHKLFRINHYGENYNELIVKFYESDGNYENETYSLISEDKIDLNPEQYKEFKSLIKGSYFWSMKESENPIPQYLDGYIFVLEGYSPKLEHSESRFNRVYRVVPYKGSFRQACEKLMEFYEQSKTEK
ncbi:hypothetical protein [Winogradskyella sp.]|uniref:hypothetical protein n=1 Tax=Winogradskyella sp. TaxID=1883156 RepID=UPI001B1ECAF5|nr:hypothetical protein [Winogradskyella sp.]MBO6881577.1 hypothetical protein [Winogradskyella sp.]